MTDYSSVCYFFDFLMEGKIDPFTGSYFIEDFPDEAESEIREEKDTGRGRSDFVQPRSFFYCKYVHHAGIATIQYKTFFHMCRLEVHPPFNIVERFI